MDSVQETEGTECKLRTGSRVYRMWTAYRKQRVVVVSWCFEPSQPLGIRSGLKRVQNVDWVQKTECADCELSTGFMKESVQSVR